MSASQQISMEHDNGIVTQHHDQQHSSTEATASSSPPSASSSSSSLPSASSTSSPPSPSSTSPLVPSRRVRVYRLGLSGGWLDYGIGWMCIGNEIPVGFQDSEHQTHIRITHETKATHNDSAQDQNSHPVGALGLPSMIQPPLLTLHVPHAYGFGKQADTIITFTTRLEAQHHRANKIAQAQAIANHAAPIPDLVDDASIDLALSFQTVADANCVWEYVHTFPEIQVAEEAERAQMDEEEEEQQQQEQPQHAEQQQQQQDGSSSSSQQQQQQQHHPQHADQQSSHARNTLFEPDDQQEDGGPSTTISSLRAAPTSIWAAQDYDESDEIDELVDPPQQQHHQQQHHHTSPFFSNSTDAKDDDDDDPLLENTLDRTPVYSDLHTLEQEEADQRLIRLFNSGGSSHSKKGDSSHRLARRPPFSDHNDEDSENDEDSAFPSSIRIPTLANLDRIHTHINALLNPATVTPNTMRGGGFRMATRGPQNAAVKKRQAFVSEITKKSAAAKKNQFICSAKRPVATRPPRGSSPAIGVGSSPTNSAASSNAATPVPSSGASAAAASSSIPFPLASPPPAPVGSPADLNWCENLSVLLRTIDHEIEYREEHGVDVRVAPPSETKQNEEKHDGGEPPVSSASIASATSAFGVIPSSSPHVSSPSLIPESATLSTLLSCASQIHIILSLLFSFNSTPLLNYLFDTSSISVHVFYYQWFLVITAYEYEDAEERKMKHLESASLSSGQQLTHINSHSLWHRHRTLLKNVIMKSPFPLQMTHVIDVAAFNYAVTTQDQAALSQLTLGPTRFGMQLLSSYFIQYVRDTFLYSPRTLDDPILITMNQQIVYKNMNQIMAGILQAGEAGDSNTSTSSSSSAGGAFGLKRTQSNFNGRQFHTASSQRANKRKSDAAEIVQPKWTKYLFEQIEKAIQIEDQKYQATANDATMTTATTNAVATAAPSSSDVNMEEEKRSESTSEATSNPSASPTDSAAATYPLPGVFPIVSRLTSQWCPLVSLTFCSTLPEHIYGLHSLFALTKNMNTPNGVAAAQKTRFFQRLLTDGVGSVIEHVLQFCARQQRRIQQANPVATFAASSSLPPSVSGGLGAPPSFTSSLNSIGTLTWLRLLCLDFLSQLQSSTPDFIRSHLSPITDNLRDRMMFTVHLHAATDDLNQQQTQTQMQQQEETKKSSTDEKMNVAVVAVPASAAQKSIPRSGIELINKYWKQMHEDCRSRRLRLSESNGANSSDMAPLQDSILGMCFQMMTDAQSSVGVRHAASSLIRLCLDPEHGSPSDSSNSRDMMSGGGGEMGGFGSSSGNPLVSLIALGGIGSTAAKQMKYDSEKAEDEDEDENEPQHLTNMLRRFDSGGRGFGGAKRHMSEQQKAQKRAESKRLKKARRQRIKAKQKKLCEDAFIQMAYTQEANAMQRVIDLIKSAAQRWTQLQTTHGALIPSRQLAEYNRTFPQALLNDSIDFLSFFALRHSIIFQEFVISTGIFDILVAFLPKPQLTQEEIVSSTAALLQQEESKSDATEEKSSSPSSTAASSSVASSPPLRLASLATSSSNDIVTSAPTSTLCAILRFLRICLEADKIYVQPVVDSSILLHLIELFLQNLRPNMLHSTILEVFTFIDSSRSNRMIGQLQQGNQYVMQEKEKEAKVRQSKSEIVSALDTSPPIIATPPLNPVNHDVSMISPHIEPLPPASSPPISSHHHATTVGAASLAASAVPILPAAPDHQHTVAAASLPPPITMPYLSAAYGINRVVNLSMWPRHFVALQSQIPKTRTTSDAATEVMSEVASPAHGKRRRTDQDEEDSVSATSEDEAPSSKRTKVTNEAGGMFYSGSEAESGASTPTSDESSDDESDAAGGSTAGDGSESSATGEMRRASLFDGMDLDDNEEDDATNLHQSRHQQYLAQRQHAEMDNDQEENAYFNNWQGEDAPSEEKSSRPRPVWPSQSQVPNPSAGPYALASIAYADDDDEDMFAPLPGSNVPSSPSFATATAAKAAAAATNKNAAQGSNDSSEHTSASDAAETAAAEKRLAEFEARKRIEREQRESASSVASPFSFGRANPSGATLPHTTLASLVPKQQMKPFISFNLAGAKKPTSASSSEQQQQHHQTHQPSQQHQQPHQSLQQQQRDIHWIPTITGASIPTSLLTPASDKPADDHQLAQQPQPHTGVCASPPL